MDNCAVAHLFVCLILSVPDVFSTSVHFLLELTQQQLLTKQFKQQLKALTDLIRLFLLTTSNFQSF